MSRQSTIPGQTLSEDVHPLLESLVDSTNQALASYCSKRLNNASCHYPGQFVDDLGTRVQQSGIAGIYLFVGVSKLLKRFGVTPNPLIGVMEEKCVETADKISRGIDQVFPIGLDGADLLRDHSRLIVKRAAFMRTQEDTKLRDEIAWILNLSKVKGHVNGIPFVMDSPGSDRDLILSAYVVNIILDSCGDDIHGLNLDPDCLKLLKSIVMLVYSAVKSLKPISEVQERMTRIYCTNAVYRFAKITGDQETQKIARSILSHHIPLVFNKSEYDPLTVSTEIMIFYLDQSDNRDRYFRINSDSIMIEALFFLYDCDLKCFETFRGRILYNRFNSFIVKNTFERDSFGQRLTIYNLYNTMRVVSMMQNFHKLEKQPNGSSFKKALDSVQGRARRIFTTVNIFERYDIYKVFMAVLIAFIATGITYLITDIHTAGKMLTILLGAVAVEWVLIRYLNRKEKGNEL
jgi:hypothetical protein